MCNKKQYFSQMKCKLTTLLMHATLDNLAHTNHVIQPMDTQAAIPRTYPNAFSHSHSFYFLTIPNIGHLSLPFQIKQSPPSPPSCTLQIKLTNPLPNVELVATITALSATCKPCPPCPVPSPFLDGCWGGRGERWGLGGGGVEKGRLLFRRQ